MCGQGPAPLHRPLAPLGCRCPAGRVPPAVGVNEELPGNRLRCRSWLVLPMGPGLWCLIKESNCILTRPNSISQVCACPQGDGRVCELSAASERSVAFRWLQSDLSDGCSQITALSSASRSRPCETLRLGFLFLPWELPR